MKVLFAVSNDNVTTSVINKYQQNYKEIVTSKNVYYFNAIVKELQRDKNYDSVIIEEDLEPISNNNYEAIDKFLFEKLDNISDEASKTTGEDIPIILICSDRRTKSDTLLRKLFSMGIYNALVGDDRSLDKVCELMNKPRNKKEAKKYYRIDGDQVDYESHREELVSEEQIQNILAYYKKIGTNERKCVQAFDSIAKQYDNTQLRIIVKFLPMEVKAILEIHSPVYQRLMSNGTVLSNGQYSQYTPNNPKKPEKLDFVTKNVGSGTKLNRPVVIPSNMNFQNIEQSKNIQPNNGFQQQKQPIQNNTPQKNQQYVNYAQQQYNQYNQYGNLRGNYGNAYGAQQNNNPYATGNNMGQSIYNNRQPVNPYFNNTNNIYGQNGNYATTKNNFEQNPQSGQQNTSMSAISDSLAGEVKPLEPMKPISQEKSLIERPKVELQKTANNNSSTQAFEEEEPKKRRRGRPRKVKPETKITRDIDGEAATVETIKRRRGRPKKVKPNEIIVEEEAVNAQVPTELTPIEDMKNDVVTNVIEQNTIENNQPHVQQEIKEQETIPTQSFMEQNMIPNIQQQAANQEQFNATAQENSLQTPKTPAQAAVSNNDSINKNVVQQNNVTDNGVKPISLYDLDINTADPYMPTQATSFNNNVFNDNEDESNMLMENTKRDEDLDMLKNVPLAGHGKIAAFIGTSKNGISFIVNNLAQLLSQNGINTAVVDLTKNKNSYYMFTDNDANKIKIATESLKNLSKGIVNGLNIKSNLTVFTALPDDIAQDDLDHRTIVDTLSKQYEVVLLDCDFHTNQSYFVLANEIYLVQSMDALTIQPLTKFLSDLKLKNILNENKLKIVINKYIKLKKIDDKMIIGGMSKYNEPSMTLQRDLFNPKKIATITIPFDEQTYVKYLESVALCQFSLNGYSKEFLDSLEKLKNMVYPLVAGNSVNGYNIANSYSNFNANGYANQTNSQQFSNNVNDTLNKMRTNNY